ncbi:MAG: hypothetical protein P8N29_10825 [Saprospiraceae bacterium]|nr:hypothetical protein [Saprospiraceae bacterium]
MYNLKDDLGETQDLSKTNPDTFNTFVQDLEQWETKMAEPLWVEEKEWMDITYKIHKQLMNNEEVIQKSPKNIQISGVH